MKILVLNAGSSTHKGCLYDIAQAELPSNPLEPLWEAKIDDNQSGVIELHVRTASGAELRKFLSSGSSIETIKSMVATIWSGEARVLDNPAEIDIIGHRIVHGGSEYRESTLVTPAVKATIERLIPLAPKHNPAHLKAIKAIEELLPNRPQLAVFDTAFHHTIPDAASIYPGPYEWVELGIRRYGFHGISHEYCAQRAAQILQRDLESLRLITCHLGNGCSLAAIRQGRSTDTTMGFTPLEGLMMGTRSGSIDPGIVIYLMRETGYTVEQIDTLLNNDSGLKGISGISGDMRTLLQAMEQGAPRARLAFEIYAYRVRFYIGAMLASLGGLDALVFTAGVGENCALLRRRLCDDFGFLGLQLDPAQNEASPVDRDIAAASSPIRVLVVHTQEDWSIARKCWQFTSQTP